MLRALIRYAGGVPSYRCISRSEEEGLPWAQLAATESFCSPHGMDRLRHRTHLVSTELYDTSTAATAMPCSRTRVTGQSHTRGAPPDLSQRKHQSY